MRRSIALVAVVLAHAGAAAAVPLTPSSGSLLLAGTLGTEGRYEIRATLQGGNFRGSAKLTLAGQTIEGPLLERRSYLENGNCHFRFEQGRSRADIGGKCDSTAIAGRFETFLPGQGGSTGTHRGTVALQGGGTGTAAAGELPTARLTCAFQDRRFSAKWGEATQYSLQFSNMGSLTLRGSQYRAGNTGSGAFARVGRNKIRLSSGPWAGAVGTLEPDRSGRPAVVFHIEDNRRADGVHVVDPYTTRCTESTT